MALRKALAVISLWLPSAIVLLTWFAWRDRLPEELPTHWSGDGPADSSTAAGTFWIAVFTVTVLAAVVGSVVALARISGRWTRRAIAASLGATAAFAASMWIGSSAPALGVTDPLTVHLGPWILLALFSPAYGLVQLGVLPPGEDPRVADLRSERIAPREVGAGQTVAWSHNVTSKLFVTVTALMTALTMAIGFTVSRAVGGVTLTVTLLVMILSTLLVAAFCGFRVTVDWRGLRVTSMLFGFPLKRIVPEQIARVDVAMIDPMQWGGWGYRVMPGSSAIVLRRGPGLVVTQTDSRQFAITLDLPEEPAAVLLHVAQSQGKG